MESEAECARLHAVRERYISSMLTAADSNALLNEFVFAKAQLVELQEVVLEDHVRKAISAKLHLPQFAVAEMARKATLADGRTAWVFETSDGEPVPTSGVQCDIRSICPLVRTPPEALEAAMDLAGVSGQDVVADLGCGDGRVLIHAALRGARAIGFDVNPYCLRRSGAAAATHGLAHMVEVIEADMTALEEHHRFTAATVVFVYAVPKVIDQLAPLLRAAVDAGKRVIIYCGTGGTRMPGNQIQGMHVSGEAMGGRIRMYG